MLFFLLEMSCFFNQSNKNKVQYYYIVVLYHTAIICKFSKVKFRKYSSLFLLKQYENCGCYNEVTKS